MRNCSSKLIIECRKEAIFWCQKEIAPCTRLAPRGFYSITRKIPFTWSYTLDNGKYNMNIENTRILTLHFQVGCVHSINRIEIAASYTSAWRDLLFWYAKELLPLHNLE